MLEGTIGKGVVGGIKKEEGVKKVGGITKVRRDKKNGRETIGRGDKGGLDENGIEVETEMMVEVEIWEVVVIV